MRFSSIALTTWMLLASNFAPGLLAGEGTQNNGVKAKSLGGLVRDTSADTHQLEWVTAVEARTADNAAFQNDTAHEAEPENTQVNSTELRRQETLLEHLSELQAPMDQIGVSSYVSDQPTPKDRAEELMNKKLPTRISGKAIGAIRPDRYPIAMYHQPLYFEQPNLERCGSTCGYFQNAISSALFLVDLAALPGRICHYRGEGCVRAGGDCPTCHTISRCGGSSCLLLSSPSWAARVAEKSGFSFLVL